MPTVWLLVTNKETNNRKRELGTMACCKSSLEREYENMHPISTPKYRSFQCKFFLDGSLLKYIPLWVWVSECLCVSQSFVLYVHACSKRDLLSCFPVITEARDRGPPPSSTTNHDNPHHIFSQNLLLLINYFCLDFIQKEEKHYFTSY